MPNSKVGNNGCRTCRCSRVGPAERSTTFPIRVRSQEIFVSVLPTLPFRVPRGILGESASEGRRGIQTSDLNLADRFVFQLCLQFLPNSNVGNDVRGTCRCSRVGPAERSTTFPIRQSNLSTLHTQRCFRYVPCVESHWKARSASESQSASAETAYPER